ncbi:PTS transporter subunit EIIC [Enterococcus malodoratus]|uniref:PTS transporter subunit EIIC n=1 Tax=Enterococcus malodoratus TaxID=71451 RepID=UPI0037C1F4C7
MKNNKVYNVFQKLGKVLMTPVLLLPISGILVGLGSALSNPSLQNAAPFLKNEPIVFFSMLIKDAGNVINNNIPILFAMCIAYGFAKSEKATACLSGFIGYMTMNTILGSFLIFTKTINPESLLTGQKTILGVLTLDTGVFGGIIIGLTVAYLHNKFYKIQLPAVFSIFNGTRFIPAITVIVASFVGIILAFIFPPIQGMLNNAADLIDRTGVFGAFIYGTSERLLLPFGLHHFIYLPFFFTSLGGSIEVGGEVVEGAVNIYNQILNTPGMMFDIDVSKYVMNGKVLFAMFGLTGAALAIYKSALPENRKKVGSLMIAAVIPCAIMGITEPLEYSFLFVAPILFGIHALLSGVAYVLTYLFQFNVAGPSAFGGPFLSLIFNGILNSDKGSNWWIILPLGAIYFIMYYLLFSFCIKRFNLKTPGREVAVVEENKQETKDINKLIPLIVEAVGGKENIISVDACFTRLRIKLVDNKKLIEDDYFTKQLGANGIVHVGDGIQIIYGNKAAVYKSEMREFLEFE